MADIAVAQPSDGREFLLRRLHSLSGVIPIAAFLVMHLSANSLILLSGGDQDLYQQAVNRIHSLGPFLVPVEVLFIFLPLAFHAGLGIKIWLESKSNVDAYPFWCNWRYTLQRITGVIVLVFILVHLWQMHWTGRILPGGAMFDPHHASNTTAAALQTTRSWSILVYALGISAACYHFGTGLWTFLITWGVTIGHQAQRRAGYVCGVLAAALGLLGLASLFGFLTWQHSGL